MKSKSLWVIGGMGVVTMILLLLSMLYLVEQTPGVKQRLHLAEEIKGLFELQHALIKMEGTESAYRVQCVIRPQTMPSTAAERQALMENIGKYIWTHPPRLQLPQSVEMRCQVEVSQGCGIRVEAYTATIPNPQENLLRKPAQKKRSP